jgi:hypothetical protein
MDLATAKQKLYIKDLFVQCGVPKLVFNPIMAWKISKQAADKLIHNLLVLKKTHHGDLREIICQDIDGKNIINEPARTIEEQEEEKQATYDPTIEDWLDQQKYEDDIQPCEWIHELHQDLISKQEGV